MGEVCVQDLSVHRGISYTLLLRILPFFPTTLILPFKGEGGMGKKNGKKVKVTNYFLASLESNSWSKACVRSIECRNSN